jgi:hypothetical protein
MLAVLLVGAIPAPAGSSPPASDTAANILDGQSERVVKRLMKEKLVVLRPASTGDGADGYVRALVVFAQPRRRTLRLLSQTARHDEFRPELKRVRSLQWSDAGTVDEHRMKFMFMQIDYRLRTHFDFEAGRIWWELDPDFQNDFRTIEGFWELFEMDPGQTLGRFGTRVDVGPTLPIWLQDYATRKNLPKTLERVQRWVDSNGTYRP